MLNFFLIADLLSCDSQQLKQINMSYILFYMLLFTNIYPSSADRLVN